MRVRKRERERVCVRELIDTELNKGGLLYNDGNGWVEKSGV